MIHIKESAKKIVLCSLFAIVAVPNLLMAQTEVKCVEGKDTYCPLTTVPGAFTQNVAVSPVSVVKNIYGVSIGIAAVLAVVMIIWAGIEYATSESMGHKSSAKEKLEGALWGLGILLGAYIILRTINVSLVNINLENLTTPIVCRKADGSQCTGSDYNNLFSTLSTSEDYAQALKSTEAKIVEATNFLNNEVPLNDPAKVAAAKADLYLLKQTAQQIKGLSDISQAVATEKNIVSDYSSYSGKKYDPATVLSGNSLIAMAVIAASQNATSEFASAVASIGSNPTELARYKNSSMEQFQTFKDQAANIIGCANGINITASTVSCKP